MACEPNYPQTLPTSCVQTLIGFFTGGLNAGWEAVDAAYALTGYLLHVLRPTDRLAVTVEETSSLATLKQAIEEAPQELRFAPPEGAPLEGFDWQQFLKVLLPILLQLLTRRLGGG